MSPLNRSQKELEKQNSYEEALLNFQNVKVTITNTIQFFIYQNNFLVYSIS